MSEETEIKLQIIILCKSDAIDLEEDEKREDDSLDDPLLGCKNFLEMVSQYMPDAKIIEPMVISVADNIITKILLEMCKNKVDIVFITGELVEKANEIIQIISVNLEELSTKLVRLMIGIEDQLQEIMYYRPQCGMRNKTLFINLSGKHVVKKECLAAISDILIIIIYLIREKENQYSFPEQNIKDNANNCHKELFPLLSIQSAIKILIDVADKDLNERTTELVKINDACGRILWEDVYSKCNVPSFRTSSKHGYAVLVKDGKGLRKVQKEENVFPPIPLQPGTCVWVNSGAPIPEGATAVVPVKDTKLLEEFSNDDKCIEIMIKPLHGQNIKTVGYDIMKDKIIIKKFKRIGSEEIGILAAAGCKEVVVVKQLSIGVLSIGENLEESGAPLNPGFTYDINRITLISLLKHNGYSSLDFGIVRDKLSFIREKIEKALRIVDVLVTTGSINDKDLLKNILMKDFKAKIHFGNINVKPGKSTTLASCEIEDKTKYFMCLSGNPTSAYITAHLFLLPFVNRLHCNILSESAIVAVQIEDSFLLHQRPRFALTCLRWPSIKEPIATASVLSNLYKDRLCDIINANALLILPEKQEKIDILSESNAPALLIDHPRNG